MSCFAGGFPGANRVAHVTPISVTYYPHAAIVITNTAGHQDHIFYAQGSLSLSTLIVHVRFQPWAIALAQLTSRMEAVGSPGGAETLQRAFRALTASPCPAEGLTPHPCALGHCKTHHRPNRLRSFSPLSLCTCCSLGSQCLSTYL